MNSDFIYSHGLSLILTVVLMTVWVTALGGLCIVRLIFPPNGREHYNDILGHAAGIAGVVNAVLLAFIVFAAWTDYDRARDLTSEEAALVIDIWRDLEAPLVAGGHEGARLLHDPLVMDLECYLARVIQIEWSDTRSGVLGTLSKHGTEWKDRRTGELCKPSESSPWGDTQKGEIVTPTEVGTESADTRTGGTFGKGWTVLANAYRKMLYSDTQETLRPAVEEELIKRFNSLYDVRRQRIAMSKHGGLIGTVWCVVLVGGLVSVACCWLFGFKSWGLHVMSTLLVASSLGLILFLIIALEWPFRGHKQISNTQYCEALQAIIRGEKRESKHRSSGPQPILQLPDACPR
jgi:hypothetical protein